MMMFRKKILFIGIFVLFMSIAFFYYNYENIPDYIDDPLKIGDIMNNALRKDLKIDKEKNHFNVNNYIDGIDKENDNKNTQPVFKKFFLTNFDKHNSYLPLIAGDYFTIEVFSIEEHIIWKLANNLEAKSIIKPLNLNENNTIETSFVEVKNKKQPYYIFKFRANPENKFLSSEELMFTCVDLKEDDILAIKRVKIRVLPLTYLDEL